MKLVVGITGATGAPIAIRTLELLRELDVETHLVFSQWAKTTVGIECAGWRFEDVISLAHAVYDNKNLAARISSGSFRHDGMIIVPCSMKTVASIRTGLSDSLISRAADVTLKERGKLVLAVRETPLSSIHLDNLLALSNFGAQIFPLMAAYYNSPQTIDDINTHLAVRILDQLGLSHPTANRWRQEDSR
ncbi:MAG: UbiX family flavin prenyltransferase [Paraburkholderia sp.]|uniref:UbiX family flavin prenyltransferase n=1 Tax=Paraburkholderia sp. TaxID=1926495 RepID=UPI003C56FAD3